MPRLTDAKATWILAWPIMVGQLAQTGTGFVDAVMAGHLSAGDLAAVSVGTSIWSVMIVTMFGLLIAISPMASQKVGAKAFDEIPALTQQALYQSLLIAAAMMLIAHLLVPIFGHIGLAPDVAAKGSEFLAVISWGFPAVAIARVLYGYSSSLNQTKPMMIISILALLLNIPANYVLIYGVWGFPALGAVGCAWATAMCMWFSAVLWIIWIWLSPIYRETHPFRALQGIDLHTQKQLAKLAIPIGIMFFVEASAFSLIALIIAKLGTTTVASHQIALNFASLTFMIPLAISTALTVRVGQAIGAGNYPQARFIGQTGIYLGFILAVVSGSLIILFRHTIATWYTADPAVILLSAQLLLLAGIFQFSDATQIVVAGALRGYKSTRMPLAIHLTAFWVIGIPLGYALTFGVGPFSPHGPAGYWLALVIALTFAAIALYAFFQRISKRALTQGISG